MSSQRSLGRKRRVRSVPGKRASGAGASGRPPEASGGGSGSVWSRLATELSLAVRATAGASQERCRGHCPGRCPVLFVSRGWRQPPLGRNLEVVSQSAVAPNAGASKDAVSSADFAMRRLLRIPEGPASADEASAHRIFSASIMISALRCLLSYVVFPVLTPVFGAAAHVGPAIGLPIGIVAVVFDVRGIRRFWLANHRWRWPITALYSAVIILVMTLVISDIVHLSA